MADLCTRADVLLERRMSAGTALDSLIDALLPRATAAITSYSKRQFILDGTPSDRYFPMGRLADRVLIDDLSATPTGAVVLDSSGTTVATLTVATDLVTLPRNRATGDPITALGLRPSATAGYELKVTGTWGWPSVPAAVQEAAIATVIYWLKEDQALTLASPEGLDPTQPPNRGLPQKARDLLRPYRTPTIA